MPTSILSKLTPNRIKRASAVVFDRVGINRLGFGIQKVFLSPFIRAVNYHIVSCEDAASFEQHLRYYRDRFVSVDRQVLDRFLANGEWAHSKPGLLLSFDDGHRTHFEVAAPLLEKYGFTGWFFIPIGLMDLAEGPAELAEESADDVLTRDHLGYLDEHHILGSHSETHCRLGAGVPSERLTAEIVGSKKHMEELLRHNVDIFCWVGGEEVSYSSKAARLIRENYSMSFMTNNAVIRRSANPLQLQRTNIEAADPLALVRFQLSGLMDIFYTAKRRRVNELTR